MSPFVVGQPVSVIAQKAGITVPEGTKILIAKLDGIGKEYPLSVEVLAPIPAFYSAKDYNTPINYCNDLNYLGGIGHSACIYANDEKRVMEYSELLNAGRILVNTPTSQGAVGYFYNHLATTLTLGCGTGGKNITTGDVKMAYRTIGEGYPLLLCMGYTGVMDMWPAVALQKLAGSYQVILFENRGMGYSTIINDTSAFSMKLFAKDAANLMNALNIPKAHVMGWSMGTYTARELALSYPEKVDKVILYAADCGDDITIQPDSALLASLNDPNASLETILLALFPAEWLKRSDASDYFPLDIIEADPNICERQDVALNNWFKEGGGTRDRLSSFGKKRHC